MRKRWTGWIILLAWAGVSACGPVKERQVLTTPPAYLDAQVASLDEILQIVNQKYGGIGSLVLPEFKVEFTGGSIEEGYLEKYRSAKGYLVAREPSSIFVNILNPLTSSSVLVMAARKSAFEIWIPSRNQYVTGSTEMAADEENPIYNVRPTHILEGILVEPIPRSGRLKYHVEEAQDERFKYYVLGVFETEASSPVLKLRRKLWIERSSLELWRQQYYGGGELKSVITYGDPVRVEEHLVPTTISIDRPVERYSITFEIEPESIQLNREIRADSFSIEPPAGAELVRVEEGGK